MFSLYANHIEARAIPSRISQLLCLDYYETRSFLEVIKLAALMQEKRVELINGSILHAEAAQSFVLGPPARNTLFSACPRHGISPFLPLYYSDIILDSFFHYYSRTEECWHNV